MMKKLLAIVVLGLLISGCSSSGTVYKTFPAGYVYYENPTYIAIEAGTGSGLDARSPELTRIASDHCKKTNQPAYFDEVKYYKKGRGKFGDMQDFENLNRMVWLIYKCGIPPSNKRIYWTNYGPANTTKNFNEVEIAKKSCVEIEYKPDDKDFKTCVLTIIGIVNQREISHEKDMAYINAGGDIQSFEGWKVLNRVENYSKFPDIIKPKKTCIDVGYKSDDEEFKTCALTIMKIATEKEISHQQAFVDLYLGSNNASFNSFESWRILQRLDKAENRRRMNRQFKFACSLMGTCPKN